MSKVSCLDRVGIDVFLEKIQPIQKMVPGAVVALCSATEYAINWCIRNGLTGPNIYDLHIECEGNLDRAVEEARRVYFWPDGFWVEEEDLELGSRGKSDDYAVVWTVLDGDQLEDYILKLSGNAR